jgi:hypothetical protein
VMLIMMLIMIQERGPAQVLVPSYASVVQR